jgi:anaphase-promoting complex subunit 5
MSSHFLVNVIRDAIPYLETSEKDYATLQMPTCQQDVLYFLASVYNTLGMLEERDATAARHARSVEEANKWVKEELPAEMKDIWSIVAEVGSTIAAGGGSSYV